MSKDWTPKLYNNADQFISLLKEKNYSFITGVPCSLLGTLIDRLEQSPDSGYVPNIKEDAAFGLASGAYLAGKKSCVLMQNSGFGYALNVLTSLNMIYKIPFLLVISFRGYLGKDAPEHIVMGNKILTFLKELEIPTFVPEADELENVFHQADTLIEEKKIPAVIMIREGIFG
jgi:sulfopyruvate decarboxylase subunit alpha